MQKITVKNPVISEKSFSLAGKGVYVFRVTSSANKHLVAEQITKLFKVKVKAVRMINISGKIKKTGRKIGKRSDIKKAYVTLKAGEKIAIFETEEEKKAVSDKPVSRKQEKQPEKIEKKKEIKKEEK